MTTATDLPPAFLYAPDFFRINRIFTDGEQKIIRQHLDCVEANLLDVEKLMQDVVDEDHIQDLSLQKRELVDCIERCRVALAPIKKLPDDVLRCIFIICCDTPIQFLSRNSKPFLITISQVCSAWRGIALETPFLWSQINLAYDWRIRLYNLSCVGEAVKLWFTRASTCPISFEADVGFDSSTFYGRELGDLVERIITLPSHFRKLALKFSIDEINVLLGKLSPDQSWHLEELEIVNADRLVSVENSKSLSPPFSPATTFANLKKLRVSGSWNSNNLSRLLPFPRLQLITIRTTMSLALELFQQCPLLETCEIGMERSDSTIRSQLANRTSYVALPQLRNILVLFDSTEDCCCFIDRLVLNDLQSLKILAANEAVFHPNEVAEHVIALSQRSGTPNTREIQFNRQLIPILNPGILLRSLPHLEKMVTDACITLDKETLDGLANGTICPCLSTLRTGDISEATDLDAIIKMVKQREQNVGLNDLLVTTVESGKGKLIATGMRESI